MKLLLISKCTEGNPGETVEVPPARAGVLVNARAAKKVHEGSVHSERQADIEEAVTHAEREEELAKDNAEE